MRPDPTAKDARDTCDTCAVADCEQLSQRRGYCHKHYKRIERTGRVTRPSTLERFLQAVDTSGSCWTWTGYRNQQGYGRFSIDGRRVSAHRWSYEAMVGPIPDDYWIDHLCRNRACVNPAHLEAVTPKENVLRGFGPTAVNARKTHCPEGHAYTPETIRVDTNGRRRCLICHREGRRRYRQQEGREPAVCELCGRTMRTDYLWRHQRDRCPA